MRHARILRARPTYSGGTTRALLLSSLLCSLLACNSAKAPVASPPVASAPRVLRVGIATDYPPVAFKRGDVITGVEAQFARKLGAELGAKITLIETPFEELIPALLARRIDIIMSGMSITDERKQAVAFTHSYLRVGQMLLLRRADAKRLGSATAIDQPSVRVGALAGTTGEAYARGHFTRAKIQGFAGVDAAVAAVRDKQIDVFIHDAPSIWRITAAAGGKDGPLVGLYEPLTEEYLAWAVRQGDPLRGRLNAVLRKWKDSGELEGVLKRWIHLRSPAAQ